MKPRLVHGWVTVQDCQVLLTSKVYPDQKYMNRL